jgi:Cytochrome P460
MALFPESFGRWLRTVRSLLAFAVLVLSLLMGIVVFGVASSDRSSTPAVVPQYDKDGALLRPKDFYTWVFVGSSIGLSYAKNSDMSGPGMFHNVYTQPEAYREFLKTGKFPEKTIFIIDMRDSMQNVTIAKHGYTEGEAMGMDVSVKDHEHFPDGWAYFNFAYNDGKFAEKARAFPKADCFSCHAEHAASDNVFTQFYPVLRTH